MQLTATQIYSFDIPGQISTQVSNVVSVSVQYYPLSVILVLKDYNIILPHS